MAFIIELNKDFLKWGLLGRHRQAYFKIYIKGKELKVGLKKKNLGKLE